jgi:catechol 2,3-dioxygenase-like lactoylglutathione lyase family enzyme
MRTAATQREENNMLNQFPIRPTISVTDLERARKFYVEALGLTSNGEMTTGHLEFEAGGGTGLIVFERKDAPKAENTVASFRVDDLEAVMRQLRERGVKFEEYDTPELKTDNGVASMGSIKGAWFKDPDGNILAVSAAA